MFLVSSQKRVQGIQVMSDEAFPPVQISVFLGPDRYTAPQLVIRGSSTDEVAVHLRNLTAVDPIEEVSPISGILNDLQTITAAGNLVFGLAPNAKPARATGDGFTPAEVPADPWAGTNAQAAKTCKHGTMKWKEGKNGQGKPYAGWFCPSFDRANQCPPEWANN
jgi:hypothetical protein